MGLFNRKAEATETVEAASVAVNDISGDYTLDPSHTPHRLLRPPRDGHQGPRQLRGVRGHRPRRHATPANSSVKVVIKAASVTTHNEQRDGHLKTPDFFDVENYPEITFVSTNVERDGSEWAITGDLTINAVTKSDHHPVRGDRLREGPVRQHPRRLRG